MLDLARYFVLGFVAIFFFCGAAILLGADSFVRRWWKTEQWERSPTIGADHVGTSRSTVWRRRKKLEDDFVIGKVTERKPADGRTMDTSNIDGSSANAAGKESGMQPEDGLASSRASRSRV